MSAAVEAPRPTLTFRCPRELDGWLPAPTPASAGLPEWFRTMPGQAFNAIVAAEDDTLKRCPPFVDAMASGYLMPLICDVVVENGELSWDTDLPPSELAPFPRSPLGIHDPSQAAGAPFFDADQFLIKFHNLWTIEAPEGYTVLFTHPFNRFDLPFTTLTGLVDCDRYHDAWIDFPAVWRDPAFSGVLRKGTPIAQCVPVRRESWTARTTAMSPDEARRTHAIIETMEREKGVYRRRFRA